MAQKEATKEGLEGFIDWAKSIYIFGLFSTKGEKPPWYLNPLITFPTIFAIVGLGFYLVVALDGVCLLEGGEQPRHRAGRQLDAIGEFDEAPGSPADLVEARECAFDALHGLHRHTEYRSTGICQ